MSAPRPGDLSAGVTGLIFAVAFLFFILFGIVAWTNAQFAGHEQPKAETAK